MAVYAIGASSATFGGTDVGKLGGDVMLTVPWGMVKMTEQDTGGGPVDWYSTGRECTATLTLLEPKAAILSLCGNNDTDAGDTDAVVYKSEPGKKASTLGLVKQLVVSNVDSEISLLGDAVLEYSGEMRIHTEEGAQWAQQVIAHFDVDITSKVCLYHYVDNMVNETVA